MEGASHDGQDAGPVGEYTIEPVGLIPGTARFRGEFTDQVWSFSRIYTLTPRIGLADYQYNPDLEDPVSKLRIAMENLDGQYRRCGLLASEPHLLQLMRSANSSSRRKGKITPHLGTRMQW